VPIPLFSRSIREPSSPVKEPSPGVCVSVAVDQGWIGFHQHYESVTTTLTQLVLLFCIVSVLLFNTTGGVGLSRRNRRGRKERRLFVKSNNFCSAFGTKL